MRMWLAGVVWLLVIGIGAAPRVHSQDRATTADVTGVVTDQSGAVVPNAALDRIARAQLTKPSFGVAVVQQ